MGVENPVDFVRQFDAREAAESAAREAAAKAPAAAVEKAAARADAELLSPDGAVRMTYTGIGPDGYEVTREGTFRWRVAVTVADLLSVQCAMQRYTPPGMLSVPGMAEMLAVLNVCVREVPDWIPRDATGRPDWLNVDANLATQLVREVDKHADRFRQRVGARSAAAGSGA